MSRIPLLLASFVILHSAFSADWPQFRGPNGSAVSSEAAPGPKLKIAWSVDLPGRGLSSPIIVGDKLVLTCASGPDQSNLHVFCFSAADGKKAVGARDEGDGAHDVAPEDECGSTHTVQ